MSGDVFDLGRSDWEISLAEEEILEIWPLVTRCLGDRSQEVVWLIARTDGSRTWLFDIETVWAWRNTIGVPTSTEVVIPLPIVSLFNILHVLEDCVEANLYYNSNDDAFVVRVGSTTHLVDYPRGVDERNVTALYQFFTDTSVQEVVAYISQEEFQKFAPVHQAKPPHVDLDTVEIAPYLNVQFANNTFRATTDWRRAGGPRVTTSHPAHVVEEFTFSCVGGIVGRIFGGEVEDGSLTVSVDEDQDHVFITYGSTGCCIDIQKEYVMRWVFNVYRALDSLDGVEVYSKPGPNMSPTIPFTFHDVAIYATLIEGEDDQADRVRLSALVAETAGDNEATFREINALNESLTNVKVILRDDEVYAVLDIHPSKQDQIHIGIRLLGETIARFEGIDALFASYA